MNRINCNIVRDILPLYIDGVVCEDSVNAVKAHLAECEECSREAERIAGKLSIPDLQSAEMCEMNMLRRFKRRIRWKRRLAVLLAVVVTAVIAGGGFYKVFVLGSLAASDRVQLAPEFEYLEDAYLNQGWVLHILDGADNVVNCRTEYIENNAGEAAGCNIYVYTAPRIGLNDTIGSYSWGYSVHGISEGEEEDFIVNLVFKDKTVRYSMLEEGLYEPQEVRRPLGGLE